MAGFRPRTTRHFCFGKSAQNHFRPGVALRAPAMLVDSGGCATRSEVNSYLFAQTVLAESPESAPLLGHARRRGTEEELLPDKCLGILLSKHVASPE